MKRVLMLAAALALSSAGSAQAAARASVTLPLKLGSYVDSRLSCTGHDNEVELGGSHITSYLDLDEKGFVTGFMGDDDNTFVAVTNIGQTRYRVRYFYHAESERRSTYSSDTWGVHSSTSFTISGTPERSYHYCGSTNYYG